MKTAKQQGTGYSIRTDGWRYTEWTESETGKVLARELYDHRKDQPLASVNLADDPGYSGMVEQLSNQLKTGWKEAELNE